MSVDPINQSDSPGQVITFYSYKGGVGRSMALANVACVLAQTQSGGRGVLVVDWDLEAPGLHRFFSKHLSNHFGGSTPTEQMIDEKPGLLDLFIELNKATKSADFLQIRQNEDIAQELISQLDLQKYVIQTDVPNLALLKAGRRDKEYAVRVNTFPWEELYSRSPYLYRTLAERWGEEYQYVLIDSRTGETDTSGICTMIMPEKLVVVFAPNRQSTIGVLDLSEQALNYRYESDDLRHLGIFPLPSRIEMSEKILRKDWRENTEYGYQPRFERLFQKINNNRCDLEEYFNEVRIQHDPFYSYGEEIAVLNESGDESLSLSRSYRTFADKLINNDVPFQTLATPLETLATSLGERRPTVFISHAYEDDDFAKRLIADLSDAGHACWIDSSAIKGGEEWIRAIAEGILNSYALVFIVTRPALQSRWLRDEILWARKKNIQIIPLILEDVLVEKEFLLLMEYQGLMLFDSDYATVLHRLLSVLPSPLPAVVGDSKLRKQELSYLERLRLEELLYADKYTPLGGTLQQQKRRAEMRAVFELLPTGKERELRGEPKRFENAITEIRHIRRAVLLGEPGGGKTTTIWKLAAELVADALADRAAPIPLLIRLDQWTEAEQSLPEFIAAQLGDLGAYLDVLLGEKRAALLLDGLNELPASQHAIKYPQVQRFIEQHPDLLAVVSCRELDYTIDLEFDRINITPLDPLRIREFVGRYLGEAQGEALFWRIGGGEEVRAVWQVWQQAGASFELFWNAPEIPKENPNVYSTTSGDQDRLWQEKVRGKHSLMELARNPYMLLMLTSVYAKQGTLPDNRGELFQLFVQTLLKREGIPDEEQTALTEGLARVAFEMQTRRTPRNEDDEAELGNALTVLPKAEVKNILNDRLLYLAGSASILSVGEQVRFTHQLLQEYFAARCMDIKIKAQELVAYDIWLSDRWWNRTNWEEAAILLAGLYSNDCTPVVDWVAQGNPEVAAQCIVRSGAALADATRERLRNEWIPRLTDLQDDPQPQARAAVGRALGLTGWDNRQGVGIVQDTRGVMLPDIDFVEIPSGEFQYGDAKSERAAKPQRLTLPTFYISRYPITYAQFQTFLDDPAGYADARWFEGLAASDDERQMQEQSFKFASHPRETVNWYQAMAFCRWLSWRKGGGFDVKKVGEWAVQLPTEFEWERAVRGTDGRLYPYAGEYDATKGNTERNIGQTSAVGIFPHGASPYGVEEMSGNVWEWCLSNYDKPALDVRKENLQTDKSRVLRGGSWGDHLMLVRTVSRRNLHPAFRNFNVGFRVVSELRPPSF